MEQVNQTGRPSPRDSTNLDFLRASAVLLVFFVHGYDIIKGGGEKWGLSWHLGQLGVLMFFVHTCLVLMWSLERSHFSGGKLLAWFYIRRAFRIYPLSILCVLVAWVIDLNWSPRNLGANLTLTQYFWYQDHPQFPPLFTPLWTLPLEMMMYAVLPFLFLLFQRRAHGWLFFGWFLALAAAFVQPYLGEGFLVLRFAPCFLGGVVAWRWMRLEQPTRFPAWLWPISISIISIAWMTAENETYRPLHVGLFGLLLGLAIPHFRDLTWKPLVKASQLIAKYSYSIYLTHFVIFVYLFNDAEHHPAFKVIHQLGILKHGYRLVHWSSILFLPVLVPVLVYHLVEEPGIELGKRVARWLTGNTQGEMARGLSTS